MLEVEATVAEKLFAASRGRATNFCAILDKPSMHFCVSFTVYQLASPAHFLCPMIKHCCLPLPLFCLRINASSISYWALVDNECKYRYVILKTRDKIAYFHKKVYSSSHFRNDDISREQFARDLKTFLFARASSSEAPLITSDNDLLACLLAYLLTYLLTYLLLEPHPH